MRKVKKKKQGSLHMLLSCSINGGVVNDGESSLSLRLSLSKREGRVNCPPPSKNPRLAGQELAPITAADGSSTVLDSTQMLSTDTATTATSSTPDHQQLLASSRPCESCQPGLKRNRQRAVYCWLKCLCPHTVVCAKFIGQDQEE